jgi:hypothetical protein
MAKVGEDDLEQPPPPGDDIHEVVPVETYDDDDDDEDKDEDTDEDETNKLSTDIASGVATIQQVFSFGSGPKKVLGLIFGMLAAMVAGAVGPFMIFYFARVFSDLVADPTSDEYLETVRELAFTFLVLGYVFMYYYYYYYYLQCFGLYQHNPSHILRYVFLALELPQRRRTRLLVGLQYMFGNGSRRNDHGSQNEMVSSFATSRLGLF